MKKKLLVIFFCFLIFYANADNKEKIVENLKNTSNFSFQFEQNINGKVENGNCTIKYPKKIYCMYNQNNKILVSNGKSLVIKSASSYYRYPLKKTHLDKILDKNFIINKIYSSNESKINNTYINYTITENENKIDILFDFNSLELIGWKTKDIYQNTAFTLLNSVKKNQNINQELFKLPSQN